MYLDAKIVLIYSNNAINYTNILRQNLDIYFMP
jgi:hypothetical protein